MDRYMGFTNVLLSESIPKVQEMHLSNSSEDVAEALLRHLEAIQNQEVPQTAEMMSCGSPKHSAPTNDTVQANMFPNSSQPPQQVLYLYSDLFLG